MAQPNDYTGDSTHSVTAKVEVLIQILLPVVCLGNTSKSSLGLWGMLVVENPEWDHIVFMLTRAASPLVP